jgi:hypothetical protein
MKTIRNFRWFAGEIAILETGVDGSLLAASGRTCMIDDLLLELTASILSANLNWKLEPFSC